MAKKRIGNLGYDLKDQGGHNQQSWRFGISGKYSGEALIVDGSGGAEYIQDTTCNTGKAAFFGELGLRTQSLLNQYSKNLRRNIVSFALGSKGEAFVGNRKPLFETTSGAIATFKPFETTTFETMAGIGTRSGEAPGFKIEAEGRQGVFVNRKGRSILDIFARVAKTLGKDDTRGEVGFAVKVN